MAGSSRVLFALSWLLLGVLSLIGCIWFELSTPIALKMFSGLILAFGVMGFLHHGGPQITAAGLFTAATGMFVGYAGLRWTALLERDVPTEMLTATIVVYFIIVFMYCSMWWNTRELKSVYKVPEPLARWSFWLGFCLTSLSLVAYVGTPKDLRLLSAGSAQFGLLLMAIGVPGGSWVRQLLRPRVLLIAALFLGYVMWIFTGMGRLTVVVLAASVAILVSDRQETRSLKYGAIAAAPVMSVLLTMVRSSRVYETAYVLSAQGPDSEISGLQVFGQLISLGDSLQFGVGETFLATALVVIPRELWADKPFGFGFELTLLLLPENAPAGHSMVATVFGEYYYNFGWWGMPALIVTLGFAVRLLDRLRARQVVSVIQTRAGLLAYAFYACVSAGMINLVWSGTHTFVSRLIGPAAIFGILYLANVSAKPILYMDIDVIPGGQATSGLEIGRHLRQQLSRDSYQLGTSGPKQRRGEAGSNCMEKGRQCPTSCVTRKTGFGQSQQSTLERAAGRGAVDSIVSSCSRHASSAGLGNGPLDTDRSDR